MRTGLYLSLEHGREDDMAARLRDLLELVRTAREAGFELLLAGQHFLVPQFQYLQPVPVLARIAAESGDMEIGTDILQLPLLHPVQVAETVATLDQVCAGRFTLGVGLGYRPVEYESLGIRRQDRLARFIEAIELIKRLWTEDRVTFRGEHFRVEDVSIAIRPVQVPRPPILVAATGDRMVRRAATLADAWSAFGHGTLDTLVRQTALYREALADAGKPFPPQRFRVSKELYVAATREQAQAECFPYIRAKYDAYRDWGQDTVLPPGESFEGSMAELTSGRFIIGSPDDCLEAIAEHHALLGFRDFCFRLHYPGMPHAQVMRALGLFAERVLPEVAKL
ncbi:MAG: LLM class flavin-dependent oxidoreductase [Chromatiales bacterium]|nr:LLM class flavin-dependent oxidoreductase [Chromatiales bacterium]